MDPGRIDQSRVFILPTMLVLSWQAGGGRWLAPETAMRTDRVVVNPPAFDDHFGFLQRVEELAVEQLLAHLPVKRFAVAILPR